MTAQASSAPQGTGAATADAPPDPSDADAPASRRPRPRLVDGFLAWTLAGAGACYGFFIWRASFVYEGTRYFTLFDDAMISMTYARNLAQGDGLVWNAGGERVEGYTNPLWTVVMAVCHRLGLSEALVPLAVSLVSLVLLLGCMVLAAALARRLRPTSRVAPRAAALLVGAYYPLVYWALRGMEVGLVTFLILAAAVLALRLADAGTGVDGPRARDIVLLCVTVAAGLLTRDDFVVPAAVVGGWLLVRLRGRARWSVALPLVVTGVAVLGGQLVAREAYYGEPLPNTYYLKVSGQPLGPRWWRGLMTLLAIVLSSAVVLIGVDVAGLRARRRTKRGEPALAPAMLPVALAAALALYSVYVGGDAWEWSGVANRYLTPAVVALLILAAAVVEPLAARIRTMTRPAFGVTLVALPALCFLFADSFVGVLVQSMIGDYLSVDATSSSTAALAALVLAAGLGLAWFAGRGRALPRRLRRGAALPVLLAVSVGIATTGANWWSWTQDGGFYVDKNRGATALGLELATVTEPGASIAVIWAGAPIYYAHRDGVDLLGKMDPVIAHGPHHEGVPMYPGHDKFDFAHSIGDLRPDVIAQYAWLTADDVDRFVAQGYQPVRFDDQTRTRMDDLDVPRQQLWVRADSDRVHRDRLVPVPVAVAKAKVVERG